MHHHSSCARRGWFRAAGGAAALALSAVALHCGSDDPSLVRAGSDAGDGSVEGSDGRAADGGPADTAADAPTSLLKPSCRGLMVRDLWRDGVPPAMSSFIEDVVVSVDWSRLESADQVWTTGADSGWSDIDRAIAGGYRCIRLRIRAGVAAPEWVKSLGGRPAVSSARTVCTAGLAVETPDPNNNGCIPYYWEEPALNQYDQLMQEVARRYEGVLAVGEVVDAACMTLFAEPFYRAHKDAESNARLRQAGLTRSVDIACHERALAIHERIFRRTRTSLAVNPLDVVVDRPADNNLEIDWPSVKTLVDKWRGTLGPRLVLQNNGLGEADVCDPTSSRSPQFCYLANAAPPKGFQTETFDKLGGTADGLLKAIANGRSMGASFIELPRGFAALDAAKLKAEDDLLEKAP